ncbi:MAG TPA: hypothetical protein PLQ36_00020 [Candidatus Gracilibacteria bacterium]|nr:hypothetical protein [Candidatus Gracilibacteria bacterium]
MKKYILDFSIINNEEKLYNFLELKFHLKNYLQGDWGRNLAAFKDLYEYADDEISLELSNIFEIKDEKYRLFILEEFLWVLTKIQTNNSNFSYILKS